MITATVRRGFPATPFPLLGLSICCPASSSVLASVVWPLRVAVLMCWLITCGPSLSRAGKGMGTCSWREYGGPLRSAAFSCLNQFHCDTSWITNVTLPAPSCNCCTPVLLPAVTPPLVLISNIILLLACFSLIICIP